MAGIEVFRQVDRRLLESKNYVIRDEAEIKRISDYALKLANGNADGARRLLRAAMYQFYGQTWDESLFYAEDSDDLMEVKDICDEMEKISREGIESISGDLVDMACQSLVFEIADSPFYVGMTIDLLGKSVAVGHINGKLEEVGLPTLPEEVLAECERHYGRVVERCVVEWEDDLVALRVFDALMVLEYWENEMRTEMTKEERGWAWTGYLNNCFTVDQILNEALARGLVSKNKKLTYTDNDSGNTKVLTLKEAMEILQRVNK